MKFSLATVSVCGLLTLSPTSPLLAKEVEPTSPEIRIEYYTKRIDEQPRLYAAYIGLSQAYLDMARKSEDPSWLISSRNAADRSLTITPSMEGYKMQARIDAFRHNFVDALAWAKKADALRSEDFRDGETSSLLAEAYAGLGLYELARKELPNTINDCWDYYTAAALGNWLVSQQRGQEAAQAFEKAYAWALAANSPSHAAWALAMAAGTYIDAGDTEAARPYLTRAQELDPANRELLIHEAEILDAEGRAEEAIAHYELVLDIHPDAEISRRLMVLERIRGNQTAAEAHFHTAEQSLRRIQKAGEKYADKLLGQLYQNAD